MPEGPDAIEAAEAAGWDKLGKDAQAYFAERPGQGQ